MGKGFSTNKILTTFIIVNIVALGAYGFVFWRIVQQSRHVQTFLEELTLEVDREARLRSLSALVEDIQDAQTFIDSRFVYPDENAVVNYITLLESLARYTPVELEVLSVDTGGNASEGTGTMTLSVSANGTREAIARFVSLIEAMPIVTTIESARVSITQDIETQKIWSLSLTLRAYMAVEKP